MPRQVSTDCAASAWHCSCSPGAVSPRRSSAFVGSRYVMPEAKSVSGVPDARTTEFGHSSDGRMKDEENHDGRAPRSSRSSERALAFTNEGSRRFSEFLNGLKEAPAVVSTTGTGTFRATISRDETEINYVLTFEDLEGDVRMAHIHIGLPQNMGGIVLWLCDSAQNPAPSDLTPACAVDPLNAREGRVTGTLTAADVQSLTANGIAGPTATTRSPGPRPRHLESSRKSLHSSARGRRM